MNYPFLKLFLPPHADQLNIIWLKNGQLLPDTTKEQSVDIFVVEYLDINIEKILIALKTDGQIILFGKNPKSYLEFKKKGILALFKQSVFSKKIRFNGFAIQESFSTDGERQNLFGLSALFSTKAQKVSLSRAGLKNYLFQTSFFQPFMPFWGIVVSKKAKFKTILSHLSQQIKELGFSYYLTGCFLSKTGMAVLEYKNVIARIGFTETGNWRIKNNCYAIKNLSAHLSKDNYSKVPIYIDSGSLSQCYFCIETKVKGIDAESLCHDESIVKFMMDDAFSFLVEYSMQNLEIVIVDDHVLLQYFKKPINQLIECAITQDTKDFLQQIMQFVILKIKNKKIPLVCQHGDYKIENMRFDPLTGKLTGVFDWDMAVNKGLPALDLYHLLMTKEVLLTDSNLADALKKKLFPLCLSEQEEKLLRTYYKKLEISEKLERVFAIMYWIGQLYKGILHGEKTNAKQSNFVDNSISLVKSSVKKEFVSTLI